MTYDTYNLIFIVSAILAGVMLVVTVILFFVLKIPRVIGDLSGSTERKAVRDIQNQTSSSGKKAQKPGTDKLDRSGATAKISSSGQAPERPSANAAGTTTEELGQKAGAAGTYAPNALAPETTALYGAAQETTALYGAAEETTALPDAAQETTALYGAAQETTALPASAYNMIPTPISGNAPFPAAAPAAAAQQPSQGFVIEYELTYIHSNEQIP